MSSGSPETKTSTDPWSGVKPYLTRYKNTPEGVTPAYEEAARLYAGGGPQYFQGQTYADRTATGLEGRGMQYDAARGMLPTVDALQSSLMSTLNASDVANNPYVNGMADMITGRLNRNLSENLMPAASQGAMAAGQLGGGRHGVMQGQAIQGTQQAVGDSLAQLYGSAYNTGMDAQMKAQAYAPETMRASMMPGQMVSAIGAEDQSYNQMAIDDNIARYNAAQLRPEQNLDAFMSRLMGAPWESTTSMASGGSGRLAGAAGGAMLGSMIMPGFGTAAGAALGGLFG